MAMSQMMTHYLSIKEQHKDCLIFYRLGDFYEMFFEDAVLASKVLGLTLTGRDCGEKERAPMCGVPYHAVDQYIAKLLENGLKVAICEQLSDPKNKGKSTDLVERDVIRIVTPGTQTDENALDVKKNNYICTVAKQGNTTAIAWADITTGEFFATKFDGADCMAQAIDYLLNLLPSEILANDEALMESKNFNEVRFDQLPRFSSYLAWTFNEKHAEITLNEQFHTSTLAAFGINSCPLAVGAAGALIEYLKETQKHAIANISSIKFIYHDKYMTLDNIAVRNLELLKNNSDNQKYGSLLWLLDKTSTGMGGRTLARLITSPLNEKEKIDYRLSGVEELFASNVVRMSLAENLKSMYDLQRLSGKISNNNLNPKDCVSLASSLSLLPSVKFQLAGFSSKILQDINRDIQDQTEVCKLLERAIDPDCSTQQKDGGYIRSGYNEELDKFRALHENASGVLKQMEAEEQQKTAIPKLKIGYNRVFGYYFEVSNSYKNQVPDYFIRRQTLVNGERFVTPQLKELEEQILSAEENALRLESQLFNEVKEELSKHLEEFKTTAVAIGMLDCLISFATVAKQYKYVKPQIVERGEEMHIVEGRHPVIEAISREKFVPNDTNFTKDSTTMIITGPNMAGKSTYMRQTALIVLMAHIGCFVPATKAVIPVTDRIFTRVGASDNLINNRSTFMVEMTEVANILLHATKNSLLVLDEVGRGTSTYDGLSIAWAVVEYLTKNIGAKTLFATHYHELTELEGKLPGVKNYKVTVKEVAGSIVFLRKIVQGGANKSFGVEVASLAGIPREVTTRAKQILKTLERNDVNNSFDEVQEEEEVEQSYSEVEQTILSTDVNTLSPVQALLLLSSLKDKLSKE